MGVSKRRNYPQPLVSTLLVTSLMALGKPLLCQGFPRLKEIYVNVVDFPVDFLALSSIVILMTL